MLKLPIYLRGSSYYLHTRLQGVQFKRSLQTSDKKIAIIRASRILEYILTKLVKPSDFDLTNVKPYEIDISKGIFRADGPEDHQMMMEALKHLPTIKNGTSSAEPQDEQIKAAKKSGLTLPQVLDKFFLVKSHLSQATVLSYRKAVTEFSTFLRNPIITNIGKFEITRYQEFLAGKKNTTRTIDNKISILRTVFNFSINQGYFFSENPAKERNLQSGKSKAQSGYSIFDIGEIRSIYSSDFMKTAKAEDPDYYWVLVLALLTGCRISEITALTKSQLKTTENGVNFIRVSDSKTKAGEREIPISKRFLASGFAKFFEDKDEKIFKYNLRLGKGSGNAVGKKFRRHLDELKINRDKLVFHSLRKFCNNFLKENEVSYEVRCQFIGHEVEDINNTVYANKFTTDNLALMLERSINKLELLAGVVQTKF